MDQAKYTKFLGIFEKLVDCSCKTDEFDREEFVGYLSEICELFKIAKGVTEFYVDQRHEAEADGEIICDYDNGKGEVLVLRNRLVTKSAAVIIGNLYVAKEDMPIDREELEKADLVFRHVLAFVARNRLQKAVSKMAYLDNDGYPNLRAFGQFVENEFENDRLKGHTAICFNIKHFSVINQDVGRSAGDKILRDYYEILRDTIGEKGGIFRMGGDNFLMVVDSTIKKDVLNILSGYPIPYDTSWDSQKRVLISARAGVSDINDDINLVNPGQIIETVYSAVQVAKQRDDSVVYFNREFQLRRKKIMKVRQRFDEAIKAGEFRAFYQPKVDVFTGEVVGAEALCRWFHEGEMIMPMDFIPILELSMDICKLDFHMLEIVCRDARARLDEGKKIVRVSVNLSRKHLVDADLLEHILEIIDRYEVPHQYIEIELTETTTDVEFKNLNRIVTGLQEAGVYTSVDDFGNGYSSLNLIRVIPWNVLKVDKALLPLGDEDESDITHRMYSHVISMANDIGIKCVTEGVETKKQVEILKENGCRIAQGYYFDKPLPAEEFKKRLEDDYYKRLLD